MRIENYIPPELPITPEHSMAEMAKSEQHFLAWLLRRFKPKKLLEVGTAAGGTSALLLKLSDAPVYSVDMSTQYYRDTRKPTGFKVSELCTEEEKKRYHLLLGHDPVDVMDQVGDGVDFCLLDTAHNMPGELLHFLAVYRYLKHGCILALHDLRSCLH